MITEVIKKDGSRQPFDGDKLRRSIELACQDAGVAPERSREVIELVSSAVLLLAADKTEISTTELKAQVLGELDKTEPSAAEAWRRYEAKKEAATA